MTAYMSGLREYVERTIRIGILGVEIKSHIYIYIFEQCDYSEHILLYVVALVQRLIPLSVSPSCPGVTPFARLRDVIFT